MFTHAYYQGKDGQWYLLVTVPGDHQDFYRGHGFRVCVTEKRHTAPLVLTEGTL